jgi:mono/diheme cytochrome c family protein
MDMANQISTKPQEGDAAVRPFPSQSVPMAGTKTTPFVHDAQAATKLSNPVKPTVESIANGRRLYAVYCVPCHGTSGTGDGLVGEKFMARPFNLTTPRVQKEVPDGHIFAYITYGDGVMPSYGNDMSPSERWNVVNYIRHGLVADQKKLTSTADKK